MKPSLDDLTLSQAVVCLKQGEFSAVELVEAALLRIQALDGDLNCFITLLAETALAQAERLDQRRVRLPARHLPALWGIPIGAKDLFETAGVRTTAGSLPRKDHIPMQDATVIRRLRKAGAVLLGKLNMHEIALGVTNVNPHYGTCRNPWHRERITGGSSGGSAAAVAAGLCLGALGSDTGGSIRIPAALCGVTGFKPTYGRVSLRGVFPLSWHMDHAGPLAHTVEDAARLYQAIAGYDAGDASSVHCQVPDPMSHLDDGVRGWRVALASDEFFQDVESVVGTAVEEAAYIFGELGAQVERVEVPAVLKAARANRVIVAADAAAVYHEELDSEQPPFGEDVLRRLQAGRAFSSTEYALARRAGVETKRELEAFFERYNLLLTPSVPILAPPIEGPDAVEQAARLTRFTAAFNITGLPALSLPCGFGPGDLPVGLQLVTRPWAEAELLRAGHAFQTATDWHTRRPQFGLKGQTHA